MAAIPELNLSVIESISKLFGDTNSGFTSSQIATLLSNSRIEDCDSANTKWRRLNSALVKKQRFDNCANNILAFIENAMSPARHYDNQEWFNDIRFELNKILAFAGYSLGENGKISITSKSSTISESAAKASKLKEHRSSRYTEVLPGRITCR